MAGVSILAPMASMLMVVVVAVVVPFVALVTRTGCCVDHHFAVLPVNFRA